MPDDPRLVPSQSVVYDVGDLLDRLGTRLDAGFSRIETKLDGKADKVDLARINARLDEHTKEIDELRDRQRSDEVAQQAVKKTKTEASSRIQSLINISLAVALVMVGVLAALHI